MGFYFDFCVNMTQHGFSHNTRLAKLFLFFSYFKSNVCLDYKAVTIVEISIVYFYFCGQA